MNEAAAADFLLDLVLVLWLGLVAGAACALPLRWLRRRRPAPARNLPAEWEAR